MRGRLNLFQAAMIRWRALYPYNAVHVVRIDGALALDRLQQAIDAVVARFGLTGLVLDAERRRYEYRGGPMRAAIRVLPRAADPDGALDAAIERELNAPFPADGPIDPFRFFALERDGGFDLGLGYDHFVAAGDSIVVLLKAIVEQYRGAPATEATPELYPPTYGTLFRRQAGATLAGLRRLPMLVGAFRRAFRPRYPYGDGRQMAFRRARIDAAGLGALRKTARGWGVTVNDLLLALLLLELSPRTAERRQAPRRTRIAVATIVNVRGDCGPAAHTAFGQFLSSFLVAHPVPPDVTLEALARAVAADTGRIKREKLYLQTLLAMAATGLVLRYLRPDKRERFHGRAYPVWAGTTSVNVDAIWREAPGAAPVPEYVRAVPTGPQAPLVVAVTTAAGSLRLGFSFRTAAFTGEEIARMEASILRRIEDLAR